MQPPTIRIYCNTTGADLGFIKGVGLIQGTNLLGRGVRSHMLELGGVWGHAPPGKF